MFTPLQVRKNAIRFCMDKVLTKEIVTRYKKEKLKL